MHILHDLAIFVIFATISKNRKLLSRYRFIARGIAAYPGVDVGLLPPGDSSLIPPRGVSSLPPPRWVSDAQY